MDNITQWNNTPDVQDYRQAFSQSIDQKKKPWWTALISEAGGALGTAAAVGAAPFTGGASLAALPLLAGAGAFGGKLIENKVRDNKYNLGSALTEGGLTGALSFLPGGKIAGSAEKAVAEQAGKAGVEEVAQHAEKSLPQKLLQAFGAAPEKPGLLESTGKNIKTGGLGLAQGASAKGIEGIGAERSQQLVTSLFDKSGFGLKVGAPETVQAALEPKLSQLGKDLGARYADSKVTFAPQEIHDVGNEILNKVLNTGGIAGDKEAQDFAFKEMQQMTKAKNPADLWKYTKELETRINFNKAAGAAEPAKQVVANIIHEDSRALLNKTIPELAGDNALYHNGIDANKLLIKASTNPKGSISSRLLSLTPVKAAEAKGGNLLENIGKASNTVLARQARRQIGGKSILGLMNQGQPPQQSPDLLNSMGGNIPGQTPSLLGGMNNQTGTAQSNLPAIATPEGLQQAMMQDFVQTGGKHFAELKALSEAFTGGVAKPLSATQQQQANNASSGLSALQTIQSEIQKNPNALAATDIPGQGLPLIGGYVTNATGQGILHTARNEAVDVISRLRTGAAINAQEEQFYKSQLPKAGDNPQVIQYKLNQLGTLFNRFVNPQPSTNTTDLLSQLNGQ